MTAENSSGLLDLSLWVSSLKWICDHSSELQFKLLRNRRKKKVFRGFNGNRTRGLCVRAAVLYQLSYEDPYTGGRPIYSVHQPVKGMKHRMKWLCDHDGKAVNRNLSNYRPPVYGFHSSAGNALQRERRGHAFESRWSPEKLFFGLFRNCWNCDSLRWSHIHIICIPTVHIISLWVSSLEEVRSWEGFARRLADLRNLCGSN